MTNRDVWDKEPPNTLEQLRERVKTLTGQRDFHIARGDKAHAELDQRAQFSTDVAVKSKLADIVWDWLSEKGAPMTVVRLADMFHAIAAIEGGIGYTACHQALRMSEVLNGVETTLDEYEAVRVMLRAAIRQE